MSNLQQQWSTNPFEVSKDVLLRQLESLGLIDVGIIQELKDKGKKALVALSTGDVLLCEVIGFGNGSLSYTSTTANCFCLVLYPKSSISCVDYTVHTKGGSYSKAFAKCIPISPIAYSKIGMSYSENDLTFITENYSLSFNESNIKYQNNAGVVVTAEGGKIEVQTGKTSVVIDAEGIRMETEGDVNLTTEGTVNVTGDVSIDGNLTVGNDIFTVDTSNN